MIAIGIIALLLVIFVAPLRQACLANGRWLFTITAIVAVMIASVALAGHPALAIASPPFRVLCIIGVGVIIGGTVWSEIRGITRNNRR